jgi:hypothetical protein
LRSLFDGQAAKKSQFDNAALLRIELRQFASQSASSLLMVSDGSCANSPPHAGPQNS